MSRILFCLCFCLLCLVICSLAGDMPDSGLQSSLEIADKLIAEGKHEEAAKLLLDIEGDPALDQMARVLVYRKFLKLYAPRDDQKRTEYAKKMLALTEAGAGARAEALSHLAEANNFESRYWAYYVSDSPKSREEVDAMEKDHRFALEEIVKLNSSNADCRIALGNQYLLDKAADKAAGEFNRALGQANLSPRQQADALIGLANAAILKNDRPSALRHCKELSGRKLVLSSKRNMTNPIQEAQYFITYVDQDLDFLKLPCCTRAKAFPTPQQAVYSKEFVPLTSVQITTGPGMKEDDLRLRLLKIKFERFGIKFDEKAAFTIQVNSGAGPRPPNKPEGYALSVTRTGAAINSRDAKGALWGIVSLIQLIDPGRAPRIRLAEITDYPAVAVRGFLQSSWKNSLEYMLFCKLNTVVSQAGPHITANNPGIPWSPLQKEICRMQSETFAAFGLRHYYGIMAWTMWYKLPLSSERTFDLQLAVCSEIARHGGHVYYPYDDLRFPMPRADTMKYGAAANIDAKHVSRLFQAVRGKYPGFQMVFCPPFYWGPHSGNPYDEPREDYLKSLGDFLDPAVDVFWTGPKVKGYRKTPEEVAWITDLIGRKPMVFQNGTGQHNLLSYITDEERGWKDWHYPGFFDNDIAGYLKNAHMGAEAAPMATLADCLWNIEGYDPASSIRRAVALLYGGDMFDILDPANKAIAYFDKYPYGGSSPEAARDAAELAKHLATAEAAWKKALEYNAFSLEQFPGALGRAINEFGRKTLNAAGKP